MKKIKNDLHSKAVALCEGQIVECSSHFVKAITIPPEHWSCYFCEMGSVCNMEMCDLCAECDGYSHQKHILKFAYKANK